jgi:hypothetical protein
MVQTLGAQGLTFILSGSRQAEFADYAARLTATQSWMTQSQTTRSRGVTNIVITDDPNDLPASIRAQAYNMVYGDPAALRSPVQAATFEPAGNTAYVLFNRAEGVDVSGTVRDQAAAFTHEVFHIGETGTRDHPTWWVDNVRSALAQMGVDPEEALSYPLRFNYSSDAPQPTLDTTARQNENLPISRDDPVREGELSFIENRGSESSLITESFDQNGDLTSIERESASNSRVIQNFNSEGDLTSASGINSSGATWSENVDGDNSTFTFASQTFGGPQFTSAAGLTLGSTIGGILGGNSIAGRIAGSTVVGALGQSVGAALVANGLSIPLLGGGSLNASLFDQSVRSTVQNFGGDLAVNAVGNIAGGLSSLLFGEAAHALGLNGFAGGLFTTIGTSITSQLATNLGAMTLNSVGISTTLVTANFSPEAFIGNISGAIGGYFGSYLAAEIVPPTGIASSIGGRIGGAIGGFLASEIPVVGTFFGSLVGSVLGTLVGSLFDPHIVPWSSEMVGAVNGVLGINFWNWNQTGNPQEFTSLANMVAGNANQVLALTRRDPAIMNIKGALAAARSFPRRGLHSNEQRHVRNAQLHRVKRPHTRLIHKGERQPAYG